MKNLILLFTLLVATNFLSFNKSLINKSQLVNPILGDTSFEIKFGYKPNATTDNTLRIKTHLEYVEQLLRRKDVSGLSPELQSKRKHLLDLLHEYCKKGMFPKNYDYA